MQIRYVQETNPDAWIIPIHGESIPKNLPESLTPLLEALYEKHLFEGKENQIHTVPHFENGRLQHYILLGTPNQIGYRTAFAAAEKVKADEVAVRVDEKSAKTVAIAAHEALYRFETYRKEKRHPVQIVSLVDPSKTIATQTQSGDLVGAAIDFARNLVNTPAMDAYPEQIVSWAKEQKPENVHLSVLDENELRKMGAGGITAVGQGSVHPPRMLILKYQGNPQSTETLGIVGKGITFDSGGISIKGSDGMGRMKADMSGAAATIAALFAIAQTEIPVNVIAIAALAENLPDANAYRPGDVLRMLGGLTAEIISTDAEGRLVLADGVTIALREGATEVVDIATLTGANVINLGGVRASLISNNQPLADLVAKAGEESGEKVWQMPTDPAYEKMIESNIADIKNSGGRGGGTITGGLFIGRFSEGKPWAHIDMSGLNLREAAQDGLPVGATGFGVQLLTKIACDFGTKYR